MKPVPRLTQLETQALFSCILEVPKLQQTHHHSDSGSYVQENGETDQAKVDKVQSFLQERWLIQGLMRIPIQLDALCYTWNDLKPDAITEHLDWHVQRNRIAPPRWSSGSTS